MNVGAAKIDITPVGDVWMDGMIRSHKSDGVHDPLHARALYVSSDARPENAFVIVSVDLCAMLESDALAIRNAASEVTGVPADHIVIAASHTHSGPATIGFFNPAEDTYISELRRKIVSVIEEACRAARPASVGCKSGQEETINHYRRLLAVDGRVIMNWEPYEEGEIVRPLGEPDNEVGVVVFTEREHPETTIALMFNHAGHPNVMSGENYSISADYPGHAMKVMESELGAVVMFVNGAQGTMDIDGLKHRDWSGVNSAGTALAGAVTAISSEITLSDVPRVRCSSSHFSLPARKITQSELVWADEVLQKTNGAIQAVADGVGDDYLARMFKQMHESDKREIAVEQFCFAIDDAAFITFPGELFTEIGQRIKKASPFQQTYIIGLANGYVGYVPTREAVGQGGYEPSTRHVDIDAEEVVFEHSLNLLREVSGM